MKKVLLRITPLIILLFVVGATGNELMAQTEPVSPILVSNADAADGQEGAIVPLSDLLTTLEQNFEATFLFKDEVVRRKQVNTNKIHIGENTGQQLAGILDQLGLTYYQVDEQTYVLFPKTTLLTKSATQEQVSGTVTDASSGEPLPGVNIMVIGTSVGTTTDDNGDYSLEVESIEDTLRFSFIGYQTQEVPIESRTSIDVALEMKETELGQMVVTGYREVEREKLTSSISRVSSEQLENVANESAIGSLQGQVAGIRVKSNSGQPGAPVNVHVRGKASINASSAPLYVVDGIPVETSTGITYGVYGGYTTSGLAGINPDDIASVEVLKDAQATSIYGSRGANGVVVITTKEGESGRTKIHFSSQYGINKMNLLDRSKPLNTDEMLELLREGWTNAGKDPNAFNSELEKQGVDPTQNTDWVDALTRTGSFSQHNLSISGGDKKTQYYASLGYHNNEGSMKYLHYQRGTATISVKTKPIERLSVNAKLNSNLQETKNAQRTSNWLASPVRAMYRIQPWTKIYNEDGSYNFDFNTTYNPVAEINETSRKGSSNKIKAYIGAKLDIVKGLVFETKEDLSITYGDTDMFFPGDFGWGRNSNGRGYARKRRYKVWSTSNLLRYKNTFHSQHNVEAFIGYEAQNYLRTGSYAYATDFIPNLETLKAASSPSAAESSNTEHSLAGTFLNVNYDYSSKYSLSASVRRDGSSRFGSKKRYANFWSAGGGWNILSTLLQDVSLISELRLRSSYGISGNEGIGNYESTGRYGSGYNYAGNAGYSFTQYANPLLTWEENKSFNIGVDFGLFEDRLSGTVEYYEKNSSNLLFDRPLPATSGRTSYTVNYGSMKNSGLEVSLSSKNILNKREKGFNWSTEFNISTLKNKITKIPETEITARYIREVGGNYYTWYLPAYAGVDPETGEKLFYSSEDKSQTTTDYTDAVRIRHGNAMPKFYGGLTNNFAFKNFNFSFLLYYNWGNKLYNLRGASLNSDGSKGFSPAGKLSRYTYENRWQEPGDETDVPKIVYNGPEAQKSSRWLADGSYIRLRDITLRYNFPREMLNAIKVQSANIYVRANNLFTYIKDDRLQFDPEQSISGQQALRTPKNKTIVFGINIDL